MSVSGNTARDLAGIYNYYYNYYYFDTSTSPPTQVYMARGYVAYNLGAYRGHNYQNTSGYTGTFPSTNINLGMFLYTYPWGG
jgi:hypothetical protein